MTEDLKKSTASIDDLNREIDERMQAGRELQQAKQEVPGFEINVCMTKKLKFS